MNFDEIERFDLLIKNFISERDLRGETFGMISFICLVELSLGHSLPMEKSLKKLTSKELSLFSTRSKCGELSSETLREEDI